MAATRGFFLIPVPVSRISGKELLVCHTHKLLEAAMDSGDLVKGAEKMEVVISDCPVQAVVVYPDRAEVGSCFYLYA